MTWSNGDVATAVTAGVALLALVRPDFERLLARRRAVIDMHPAGRLEVGFSNFDPTIGLQGTLQAIRGDEFVSFGRVIIERIADNLRHEFQWAVFRAAQIFAGVSTEQQALEIASGFLLSISTPHRFSIQFHDSATADSFRQPLIDLQRLWIDYLQIEGIVLTSITSDEIRNLYNTFHSLYLPRITPLFAVIDRQFYWVSGIYRLRLELHTTHPNKIFNYNYNFTLSDAESGLLRLNCIACFMAQCNVPNATFNFAYLVYQHAENNRRIC